MVTYRVFKLDVDEKKNLLGIKNALLTPNRPLVHTSFTYPKLNMDGFSVLNGSLGYVDSTQKIPAF